MARASTRAGRRIGVAVLTLSAQLVAGCYTTHVRTDPVRSMADTVGLAVVELSDGSMLRVRQASVRADSLVGTNSVDGSRIAIPMERVRTVEVRELSAGRTGLAVFTGFLILTAVLLAATVSALSSVLN